MSWPITFWVAEGGGVAGFLTLLPTEGVEALVSAALYAVLAPVAWQFMEWLRKKFPAPPRADGSEPDDHNVLLRYGLQLFALGMLALLILTQVDAYNQRTVEDRREKIWQSWRGNNCIGNSRRKQLATGCPPISKVGIDP